MGKPRSHTHRYATFSTLAGLPPHDTYDPAPVDGVDVWPLITGAATTRPAAGWTGGMAADELLYGVGDGTTGALRQGPYKLIVGVQQSKADGWSAQYPGTTPAIPAPEKEACKPTCLFNVEDDR